MANFYSYKPAKICLELFMESVTKDLVLAFDELGCPEFPDETLALIVAIGLKKFTVKRSPLNPFISYLIIE